MQKLLMAALVVGVLLGVVFYKLQGPPERVATASVVPTPAPGDEAGARDPGPGGGGVRR
jgi:hypothetical protein